MYTKEISGVNANFLTKSIVNAGLDPNNLEKKHGDIDFGKELNSYGEIYFNLHFVLYELIFYLSKSITHAVALSSTCFFIFY